MYPSLYPLIHSSSTRVFPECLSGVWHVLGAEGKWRVIQSLSLSSWCLKSSGRIGAKQSSPLHAGTTMASAGNWLRIEPADDPGGISEEGCWSWDEKVSGGSGAGATWEWTMGWARGWKDTRMRHALSASLPFLLILGCPDCGHLTLCSWAWPGFRPCSGWLDPSLNRRMTPGSGDPCTIFLYLTVLLAVRKKTLIALWFHFNLKIGCKETYNCVPPSFVGDCTHHALKLLA